MEDLLQGFQASFSVTFGEYDPNRPHPRFSNFKFKREGYGDQEARRKRMLQEQQSRRQKLADYGRKVIEGDVYSDEDEMEEEGYDEVDGADECVPKRKRENKVPYRNQLMLSEWLVDVPADFETNWYVVVCPIAKRCLVIAHNGETRAYTRSGHFYKQFPSSLPGGCRNHKYNKYNYCILDCLFHEGQQTFYVLDVMCWGGHAVYDSDTEFRFFWRDSKLSDMGEELLIQTRLNPYKFVPLTYHGCSKDTLLEVLRTPLPIEVDGLLFFHKEALYFRGRSPIVLWLKPHMVPDVLHIPVSAEFLACAPSNDVSMDTGRAKSSKKARPNTTTAMETDVSLSTNVQEDNSDGTVT